MKPIKELILIAALISMSITCVMLLMENKNKTYELARLSSCYSYLEQQQEQFEQKQAKLQRIVDSMNPRWSD